MKQDGMHPRSKNWHLLDYVLVKAVELQDMQITRVMCGAEGCPDHRLVRTSFRSRIRPPARKHNLGVRPQRRLNVSGLSRRADLSSLRAAISFNLAQISDCSPLPFQSISDATKHWDTMSKAVMDAAVDTCCSSADGPCIVHNCKNDCAKWRRHGGCPRLTKSKTMRMQIWRISFMRQ